MKRGLVARINREVHGILSVPQTREQRPRQRADPRTGTHEKFAAAMANDLKKWRKAVATAGIKAAVMRFADNERTRRQTS